MQVTVERRGDQRKARDTGNVDQGSSAPVTPSFSPTQKNFPPFNQLWTHFSPLCFLNYKRLCCDISIVTTLCGLILFLVSPDLRAPANPNRHLRSRQLRPTPVNLTTSVFLDERYTYLHLLPNLCGLLAASVLPYRHSEPDDSENLGSN